MRLLIKLLIVLALGQAGSRAGVVWWQHVQFRDGVRETAQFSGDRSEREIAERILELAGTLQIPLAPEALRVRREQEHTLVDATYIRPIELLPRWTYPWEFRVSVDAWTTRPARASDYLP